MTTFDLFASCLPGLEAILEAELSEKSIGTELTKERGGVAFRGDLRAIARANRELGTASRILLRLASFHASRFAELVRKAESIPFERWIHPGLPLTVRAKTSKSRLYHTGAIIERVMKVLDSRLGSMPPQANSQPGQNGETPRDNESQELLVRIVANKVTCSIELSGEALHRRGYRLAGGKAPLREDLACALVRSSGWDRRSPLCDPMMGSGTIVVEAALLAAGLSPGRNRRFLFEALPLFERFSMPKEGGAMASSDSNYDLSIVGSDRDAGALKAASENAERAGVLDRVTLSHASLSDCPGWRQSAFVVTNPPYGKRISGDRRKRHRRGKGSRGSGMRDIRPLYAKLGALLSAHAPGAAIVSPESSLERLLGLSAYGDAAATAEAAPSSEASRDTLPSFEGNLATESLLMTDHGGLKVRFHRLTRPS